MWRNRHHALFFLRSEAAEDTPQGRRWHPMTVKRAIEAVLK
jgi:hypothetical protein